MSDANDPNAVLAFLLGSASAQELETADTATPSERLNALVPTEEDLPDLEPIDSEDVADADHTYPLSVQARAVKTEKKQVTADNCKGIPSSEHVVDTASQEAEHEDDCTVQSATPKRSPSVGKASPRPQNNKLKVLAKRGRSTKFRAEPPAVVAKLQPRRDQTKSEEKQAALEEFLFVGCVAAALVAYLVACVYSFFHPLVVPLPDYRAFYSAFDISNVSVDIVNPVNNSQLTPRGAQFEWKIANFPLEALHQYGAEVFQYRVSMNDEEIVSEIGFLPLEEGETVLKDADVLNKTVQFPIPLRKFRAPDDVSTDAKQFKLHLEVTIPIPGLSGELKTFEQTVYVWKPAAPKASEIPRCQFTAPADGTTFEEGQSIVLEYTAVNVHEMYVFLDGKAHLKKDYISDGNLLLRGLSVGAHVFEAKALDDRDMLVASSTVHVNVLERQNVETP